MIKAGPGTFVIGVLLSRERITFPFANTPEEIGYQLCLFDLAG